MPLAHPPAQKAFVVNWLLAREWNCAHAATPGRPELGSMAPPVEVASPLFGLEMCVIRTSERYGLFFLIFNFLGYAKAWVGGLLRCMTRRPRNAIRIAKYYVGLVRSLGLFDLPSHPLYFI